MSQMERIAQTIREYDAQGWHRTGTVTDHESAEWLIDKVRDLGLNAKAEGFTLSRIDPESCYLEVDGRRIIGLPMFDGTFTGPEGIRGLLGELGSSSDIGLAEVRRGIGVNEAVERERRSPNHRALVAVTIGDRPGLMALNAYGFWAPYGPPVLQVSSEVQGLLTEAAQRRAEVNLVASVTRVDAESFNVVVSLKGRDESLPPLVVMTPRSGWWHCASERGGGLACWLEVMRALGVAGSPRDIIFIATSAHELGTYGISAFLEHRPGFVKDVHAWIHFGANIGAAQGPEARFSATDDMLEQLVRSALEQVDSVSAKPVPRGITVGDESQAVARQGGHVVAIVGGNTLFHLESDRWPQAVDVEAVAGFGKAFTEVALQLVQG